MLVWARTLSTWTSTVLLNQQAALLSFSNPEKSSPSTILKEPQGARIQTLGQPWRLPPAGHHAPRSREKMRTGILLGANWVPDTSTLMWTYPHTAPFHTCSHYMEEQTKAPSKK